jgi:hypothetical protein
MWGVKPYVWSLQFCGSIEGFLGCDIIVPPATSFQVRGSGKIMTDNLSLFGIDNIVKTSASQV